MPIELMLKSKIVRETLKAKGNNLNEVETGTATLGQGLLKLLEKPADDKPVASNRENVEPEVTIMRRGEVTRDGDSMKAEEPENSAIIPEEILKRATLRRKRVTFKEEVEHLGL